MNIPIPYKIGFLESLIRDESYIGVDPDAARFTRYFNIGLRQEIRKLLNELDEQEVDKVVSQETRKEWAKDFLSDQRKDQQGESSSVPSFEKPPLGLMPQHHHKEQRLIAITQAVGRYIGAGKPIPDEWLEEMLDLQRWVQFHRDNSQSPCGLPTGV